MLFLYSSHPSFILSLNIDTCVIYTSLYVCIYLRSFIVVKTRTIIIMVVYYTHKKYTPCACLPFSYPYPHTYIISSFHLIKRAPKQKHEKIYKHTYTHSGCWYVKIILVHTNICMQNDTMSNNITTAVIIIF